MSGAVDRAHPASQDRAGGPSDPSPSVSAVPALIPLRVLSLFAGIGGFDLGLERTGGFKTVAFAETDPYASLVLSKRFPGVPNLGDVTTAEYPNADVIVGGFPCQDISKAGRGAGLAGKHSGLWREMVRGICVVRPRYVIVENVAKLRDRGLGTVLGDLAESGYDAEWDCISAGAVGAPDIRDRIWIVAYPQHTHAYSLGSYQAPQHVDRDAELHDEQERKPGQVVSALSRAFPWLGSKSRGRWNPEPGVRRVVDGLPADVDRLKCLGRAVKPIIPEIIGAAILASDSGSGLCSRPGTGLDPKGRRAAAPPAPHRPTDLSQLSMFMEAAE